MSSITKNQSGSPMKLNNRIILFIALCCFILFNINESQAQYGGYGYGGYGRGGMGRSSIPQAGEGAPRKTDLDPEKMANENTRWMIKKLKLTEEQIPKVENANINFAFKRLDFSEEMKKIVPPITEEIRAKLRAKALTIKEERDKEMKAILTEEQFQIYLKKKDNY